MALTQAGLRHANLTSIYTLLYATVAAVLLSMSAGRIMQPGVELLDDFFSVEEGYEACGGRTQPELLCSGQQNDLGTSSFIRVVGLVGVVFGLLWLETIFSMEWVKDQSNRYGWLKKSLRGAKRWKVPRVVTAILLLAELTLFCFTLLICIDLIASFQKLNSSPSGSPSTLSANGS